MIESNTYLKVQISGVVQLKGGLYLAYSKKNEIGIFENNELKLIGKLKLN